MMESVGDNKDIFRTRCPHSGRLAVADRRSLVSRLGSSKLWYHQCCTSLINNNFLKVHPRYIAWPCRKQLDISWFHTLGIQSFRKSARVWKIDSMLFMLGPHGCYPLISIVTCTKQFCIDWNIHFSTQTFNADQVLVCVCNLGYTQSRVKRLHK